MVPWNGRSSRQQNLESGLISSLNLTTGGFVRLILTSAAALAMSVTMAALLTVPMTITMTSFPSVRFENRLVNLSKRFGKHFLDF